MDTSAVTSKNDPRSQSQLLADLGLVSSPGILTLIYDGECPFCTRYVALYQIRKNIGSVNLVNARERPELVAKLRGADMEINNGMIAVWKDRIFYGPDSVHLMAMLTAEGKFAKINALLFRNRAVAAFIYPAMVVGRKLTLRLLGRSLIDNTPAESH